MESTLAGSHAKTFERLTAHPAPHNVQWRDVCTMFTAMEDAVSVEDEHGHLKITRAGQTLLLHRPSNKDFSDPQEMAHLRRFLAAVDSEKPEAAKLGTHLLVVIDHREARVFSSDMHGTIPMRVTPYDPFGFGRALHFKQDDSNGQRKPERGSFYEAIAKTLRSAEAILIFGSGTGASSAMEQLLAELKQHHHAVAEKVIGSHVVDEHHLTENQLLARARELFV